MSYIYEWTYEKILRAAMEQSEDFCSDRNKVVLSHRNENARKYLELPFFCQLVTYGNNVVVSAAKNLPGLRRNTLINSARCAALKRLSFSL